MINSHLKKKLIKSVHILTHLPVYVFNEQFQLENLYVSDRVYVLPYDFKAYCGGLNQPLPFVFSGALEEVFISYSYPGTILIIGPFTTLHLTEDLIKERIHSYTARSAIWPNLFSYLKHLPFFSLGDVRDFLIHLNYLFTGKADCPYSEDLHLQVEQNKILFDEKKLEDCDWRVFQPEYYTYRYEEQLLALVREGNTQKLQKSLALLSNSIIPASTKKPLRSEKNYTIVVLEKLAALAIQSGHDIITIYQLRDYYIQLLEEKSQLIDVLYVRDFAIIHFTQLFHDNVNKNYSPVTQSIIQYIGLNLYTSLNLKEISKKFFISETALCSRFKKETGFSVIAYIHYRKINESKLLLKAGLPPTEVAANLHYYDYSHFSRTFKKFTGISPKEFQLKRESLPPPSFLDTYCPKKLE